MASTATETTFTPAQAEAIRDAGLHSLATIRWLTSQAIENLTPEQWVFQASPGVNHILWNVGHLAASECHMVTSIGGTSAAVPERYKELFGGGTEPKPSLEDYPDPQEVVAAFDKAREDLVGHFKGLSGEQLVKATEGDMMKQLAPTVAQVPNFCVLHEATHAGEILIARSALGLPRVLG